MELKALFGVIGGSGLYSMPGLKDIQEYDLTTPFGKSSSPIIIGTLEGQRVEFLAPHGIGHHISPSEINYRANIYALKSLGVERIVSISACGSLREDYVPGEIVIPDQVFDFTHARKRSFFGDGLVAHVSVADPFCASFSEQLLEAQGIPTHQHLFLFIIQPQRQGLKACGKCQRLDMKERILIIAFG